VCFVFLVLCMLGKSIDCRCNSRCYSLVPIARPPLGKSITSLPLGTTGNDMHHARMAQDNDASGISGSEEGRNHAFAKL
jgi:hypothetical protein